MAETSHHRAMCAWKMICTMIMEFFVLTGAIAMFGRSPYAQRDAWTERLYGETVLHDIASLCHAHTVWLGTLAFGCVVVWGVRAPWSTASRLEDSTSPSRSQQLTRVRLRWALSIAVPIGLVVLSGLGLLGQRWGGTQDVASLFRPLWDGGRDTAVFAVHVGTFVGPLVRGLWFFTALFFALWVLVWMRGVASDAQTHDKSVWAQWWEDLPQGVAVGTSIAALMTAAMIQWSDVPFSSLLFLFLALMVTVTAAHIVEGVASSPGWRFFPLALGFAVLLVDGVQRGGLDGWFGILTLGLAFFAVLAARVGRRRATM